VAAALFCHRTTMSSGLAGRGFIANIDVAIAQDENSFFLGWVATRNCPDWFGRFRNETAGRRLRFKAAQVVEQRKVKKPHRLSNRLVFAAVSSSEAEFFKARWRHPMRALSYIIALAFVLAGPSLAGSTDSDLPGVGTFSYCGSPIASPEPRLMASVGQ
jgi:hypothetical protein